MEKKLPKRYTHREPVSREKLEQCRRAGSVKSEKKARAVRDNGLLGGRPRKKPLLRIE
jgi:hypothetical protein